MEEKELFKHLQLYHSNYQIDNFIVGISSNTLYGQFKQTVRELYSRFNTIRKTECEIELLHLQIKEKDSYIEDSNNTNYSILLERTKIERQQLIYSIEEKEINLSQLKAEYERFLSYAKQLKLELGDLTEKRKQELEKELWFSTAIENIKKDIITRFYPINASTFELINKMDEESRGIIINLLERHKTNPTELLQDFKQLEEK